MTQPIKISFTNRQIYSDHIWHIADPNSSKIYPKLKFEKKLRNEYSLEVGDFINGDVTFTITCSSSGDERYENLKFTNIYQSTQRKIVNGQICVDREDESILRVRMDGYDFEDYEIDGGVIFGVGLK